MRPIVKIRATIRSLYIYERFVKVNQSEVETGVTAEPERASPLILRSLAVISHSHFNVVSLSICRHREAQLKSNSIPLGTSSLGRVCGLVIGTYPRVRGSRRKTPTIEGNQEPDVPRDMVPKRDSEYEVSVDLRNSTAELATIVSGLCGNSLTRTFTLSHSLSLHLSTNICGRRVHESS